VLRAASILLLLLACRRDAPGRADGARASRPEAAKPKNLTMGDGSGKRTPEEVPRDKPETVLFIVMDTVRADHLSVCGYDRPTSPFLQHLRDDLGFALSCDAYSPATWTMPSHASYFTGKTLPEHAHDRLGASLPEQAGPMLAETMKERGFLTMMFAANTALEKSGLQRGFDLVRIAKDMSELRHPDFEKELEHDLAKADKSKPWFLFVNLIDAHDPYPKIPAGVGWVPDQPQLTFDVRKEGADTAYHDYLRGVVPAEKAARYLEAVRNGYDYGVWGEDQNVRAVFQVLRKLERLPGPMRVVITADHGEFIGEHGLLRHPTYLYEPVVNVPFLYHDNLATEPIVLPAPFAALSAYTLLKDGRLPDPALPVQSWSRVMDDRPIKPGEDMMARWSAGQPKLLWWNGRTLTFDLSVDPGEQEGKPAEGHPLLPELTRDAAAYKAHLERTAALPLDPETVQSLQQLGYIH
jgi:hypothetical protein